MPVGAGEQDTDQRLRTHRNLRSDDSRSSGGTKPSSSMQVAVTFAIPAVLRALGVDLVAVAAHRIVDQEWHGVERVAGLRRRAGRVLSRRTLPFLSRWNISSALPWSAVTTRIPCSSSTAFASRASWRSTASTASTVASNDAGVADHVAVRVVDAREPVLAGAQLGDQPIGDLGGLHPRPLLERHAVRRDLDVRLGAVVEHAAAVAVPEVRDVAVLLGLADRELRDVRRGEDLAHRPLDLRRRHQVVRRDVEVAVVLHHAGVEHVGPAHAIELVELRRRRTRARSRSRGRRGS